MSNANRYAAEQDVLIMSWGGGGVSVWKHVAKVKRCTYKGCTNQSQKGGLGRKHGAYHKLQDKPSASLFLSHLSALDEATTSLPNQGIKSSAKVQNGCTRVFMGRISSRFKFAIQR